jgi:iron complex outermembrane receptor protein
MKNSYASSRKTLIASAVIAATAAMVQNATAQGLVLEEVIVTAQKREASVQDIAATVNVLSGDAIDKFANFNFGEIEQQTAGLTLSTPNARNSSISMRGIGTDPEAGTPPAVDVYWNGMNVRPDVVFTQLYDLERMEILRGPQGTLQGRTSPAGAINIITRGANMDEMDGYVQASASDNEGGNGQFAVGMPLIDGVLGVRLAAVYDTNYARDVENLTTGLDNPESEAKSTRFSIGWSPTDTFSSDLVWQWLDRDVDDVKALDGTDSLAERPTLSSDDKRGLAKTNDYSDLDFDIVNLTLSWEVAGHEVTAVTGYNNSTKKSRTENDRAHYITTPEALTFQTAKTDVESWAQEIRVASVDSEFWEYMFGVYYIDQDTDTTFIANTTLTAGLPGASFATKGSIPVDNEEGGIFTFNKFYINEVMQVELGLRWSTFDRFRKADVDFGDLNYIPPPLAPFAGFIQAGIEASFPIEGVSKKNQDDDDDAVTGSLTFRYDWTDETSVYASYNRGYRPGGISIVPDPDVVFLPDGEDDLLYDEETSDAVEVGFKSRLMDGRATLNGALYYQKFDGYLGFVRGVQVLNDLGEPVDISGGLVFNGDANIWGIELEGEILVSESWSAGASLSYNNAEWDGAEAPCNEREPGEVLGSCDIDGEEVGGEPEFSASLNSEWYMPVMDNMEWYIRGLYKYTDDRNNIDASAGIGPVASQFESHSVVNLYTGVRSANYNWDVFVWAKNLFDSDEVVFQTSSDQYDLALSGGSYTQTNIQQERTVGVTARYSF